MISQILSCALAGGGDEAQPVINRMADNTRIIKEFLIRQFIHKIYLIMYEKKPHPSDKHGGVSRVTESD